MEKNISIKKASQILGISEQAVRIGLQNGTAPYGYATQMPSGKHVYHISPFKLYDYMGIVQEKVEEAS